MSTDPSRGAPGGQDRRASDTWQPPITSIRSVKQIIVLNLIHIAILAGTLFIVLPGTVQALHGTVEGIRTPVHAGPGLLLVIGLLVSLVSASSGVHAVATGHPMILRGVSSASGRFARKSMHAALLAGILALVQLLVFATTLPGLE